VPTYGWDMSHYDAPGMGSAVSDGIQFITHKAGGDANDAELGTWWQLAKPYRNQALLGAYWVLYPGAPVARAEAFLDRLDAQCAGWRTGPFILQVDCEKWGGNAATVPNRADIRAFCDQLRSRCPKLIPIVYAPKWVYGDSLTGLGYPLWASSYVNGTGGFKALYPGDGSSKWGAYSGQTPAVLQYTSSATIGGQTTCDANAYRGTLKQLTALLAPGWIETEEVDVALDAADKAWISAQLGTVPKAVWSYPLDIDTSPEGTNLQPAGGIQRYISEEHHRIEDLCRAILAGVGTDNVDESAIVAGVLAGLNPQAIADAIPGDIAVQVVDLLRARLEQ
jgi:GH25 family lysozyme M1 (1,4-beta-N-acetylmuramidase)